jgi:hypothetical protein
MNRKIAATSLPSPGVRRRQFLGLVALTSAGTLASRVFAAPEKTDSKAIPFLDDVLYGGCRYQKADQPVEYAFVRVRPFTNEVHWQPTDFLLHGWAIPPDNPEWVFFFEKEGPHAALFDRSSLQRVKTIVPHGGRNFYGHGAIARNGAWLLSTESEPNGRGAIGIRDTRTLDYLGEFPSYGHNPHDCHLIDEGRTLVVSNGGGKVGEDEAPNVAYIDVASQKLLHRHSMPDARFNTGHVAPLPAHRAVVVSAPRRGLDAKHLGAVSFCDQTSELTLWHAPERLTPPLLGEALSVLALPERNLAVISHPTPGWVTLWRLDSGQFLRALPVPAARGLALARDGQHIWVSYSVDGKLLLGKIDFLKEDARVEPAIPQSMLAGSHILNYP